MVAGIGGVQALAVHRAGRAGDGIDQVARVAGEVVELDLRQGGDVEGVALNGVRHQDGAGDGLPDGDRRRGVRPRHRGDRDIVDGLRGVGVVALAADGDAAGAKLVAGDEYGVDGCVGGSALGRQHHRHQRAAIGLRHDDGGVDRRAAAEVDGGRGYEFLRHQAAAVADGDVVGRAVAAIAVIGVEGDAQRVQQSGVVVEQVGADTAIAPGGGVQQRHDQRRVAVAGAVQADLEIEVDGDGTERTVLRHGEIRGIVDVAAAAIGQLQAVARQTAGVHHGRGAGEIPQRIGQQPCRVEILRGLPGGALLRHAGDREAVGGGGRLSDSALDQQRVGAGHERQRPGIVQLHGAEHEVAVGVQQTPGGLAVGAGRGREVHAFARRCGELIDVGVRAAVAERADGGGVGRDRGAGRHVQQAEGVGARGGAAGYDGQGVGARRQFQQRAAADVARRRNRRSRGC